MPNKSFQTATLSAIAAAVIAVLVLVLVDHGSHGAAQASTGMPRASVTHVAGASTVPPHPLRNYKPDVPFFEADGLGQYRGATNSSTQHSGNAGYFTSGYWVDVPRSYNASNRTPEALLVWMHGCSGLASFDVQALSTLYSANRSYIVISLSGPEGGTYGGPDCWDTSNQTDVKKVMTDIAQVETHFNINRRRVILSGYSSGGDLAYQTIFTHADLFAGILVINTDPVLGNTFDNSTRRAIAAAAWKFPIVQVLHAKDQYYPPSVVVPHLRALAAAGFRVHYLIRPGQHFEPEAPAGCAESACRTGTYSDIAHYLLPQIAADDWESPRH